MAPFFKNDGRPRLSDHFHVPGELTHFALSSAGVDHFHDKVVGAFKDIFAFWIGPVPSAAVFQQQVAPAVKHVQIYLNRRKRPPGSGTGARMIIHSFKLVYSLDVYGYHPKPQPFLQLFLYRPAYVKRLWGILTSGMILNYKFQVYEAHLKYAMHFYSDLFIQGCSEVRFSDFRFRKWGSRAE